MNDIAPEDMRKLLNFDGLAKAEDITGKSYKDDPLTMLLGMNAVMAGGDAKRKALKAAGDTTLNNTIDRYLFIAKSIGFETVLQIPFSGRPYDGEPAPAEMFYLMWRRGVLLVFDTYGGDHINSGNFYYNWKPNDPDKYYECTSSGSFARVGGDGGEMVWVGSHDCREALCFHISELERRGTIFEKWVKCPHLWLLHYMDTSNEESTNFNENMKSHDKITTSRIAMLPARVRDAIGGL